MPFRTVLIGIFLLCWSLLANAQATARADETVVVTAATAELPLIPRAEIIKDEGGRMTVDELMKLPATAGLSESRSIASFGFDHASYWFSVAIENPGPVPLQRLLVFEPTWLDDVRITLVAPNGARQTYQGGDRTTFEHRAVPHRQINFDLTLPPGRSRLLVRTQTQDPYLVDMTLWERSAFFQADAGEAWYFGVLYGAVSALLLYNLVLFFSMREAVYAAYVAYLSAFLVMHATYNGHLYRLLWPESPAWGNWAHSIFIYLFMLAGLFFAIRFLELRKRLPDTYRWARGVFLAILASFAASAVFGGYGWHVSSSILWVVVYSPFVLMLGILSFRSGNRAARFFLPATAAGFVGSFITAATVSGFIPFSFTTYRAVDFGMLIDAVLLSIALADHIRLSRAEADLAKAQLIEVERAHARQLEETVAQRTQDLIEANAIKDKFFAIIAHDLRGPIGSLAVLFNEALTSAQDVTDEILEMARSTTQSTRDFLEELLTWARSQRGEIDYHPVAIDMNLVLMEMQKLFSAQARAKNIHLDLHAEGHCWVFADQAMTHTILRNLIHNALKFTRDGGSVSASLSREADRCRIAITDTGVGMSENTQKNLFRLDVKRHSSPGTHNEFGTGLGLILCKEFVEKNGGAIAVSSAENKGSSFTISLPLAKELEIAALDEVLESLLSMRILVVEDNRMQREASLRILQELGCAPMSAVDGAEAIRLAAEHDFDLILMDIDLPQVDGIEAAKHLRAGGSRSRIVSLSSYSRQELNRLAENVQFDDYLYKPLTRDALVMSLAYSATDSR